MDYYLGAAAGRHVFELAFERTVDATSDYQYFAGFDYTYTPRANVVVVVERGSLDGACGVGGSPGIDSFGENSDLTYA